MKSNQTTVTGQ